MWSLGATKKKSINLDKNGDTVISQQERFREQQGGIDFLILNLRRYIRDECTRDPQRCCLLYTHLSLCSFLLRD